MDRDDWFILTVIVGLVAVGLGIIRWTGSEEAGLWGVCVLCVLGGVVFRQLSRP